MQRYVPLLTETYCTMHAWSRQRRGKTGAQCEAFILGKHSVCVYVYIFIYFESGDYVHLKLDHQRSLKGGIQKNVKNTYREDGQFSPRQRQNMESLETTVLA